MSTRKPNTVTAQPAKARLTEGGKLRQTLRKIVGMVGYAYYACVGIFRKFRRWVRTAVTETMHLNTAVGRHPPYQQRGRRSERGRAGHRWGDQRSSSVSAGTVEKINGRNELGRVVIDQESGEVIEETAASVIAPAGGATTGDAPGQGEAGVNGQPKKQSTHMAPPSLPIAEVRKNVPSPVRKKEAKVATSNPFSALAVEQPTVTRCEHDKVEEIKPTVPVNVKTLVPSPAPTPVTRSSVGPTLQTTSQSSRIEKPIVMKEVDIIAKGTMVTVIRISNRCGVMDIPANPATVFEMGDTKLIQMKDERHAWVGNGVNAVCPDLGDKVNIVLTYIHVAQMAVGRFFVYGPMLATSYEITFPYSATRVLVKSATPESYAVIPIDPFHCAAWKVDNVKPIRGFDTTTNVADWVGAYFDLIHKKEYVFSGGLLKVKGVVMLIHSAISLDCGTRLPDGVALDRFVALNMEKLTKKVEIQVVTYKRRDDGT